MTARVLAGSDPDCLHCRVGPVVRDFILTHPDRSFADILGAILQVAAEISAGAVAAEISAGAVAADERPEVLRSAAALLHRLLTQAFDDIDHNMQHTH